MGPQKTEFGRIGLGALQIVGAAVAAVGVLPVPHPVVTERVHARSHLARMRGMHAIVARRRRQQQRRIRDAFAHAVIRRIRGQRRAFVGIVRIAVFVEPRGARMQLRIAPHVEQRHAAQYRAEQRRALHHAGGDQQPAVAAALDAELRRRRHAGRDQILGHRDEIVERALPVLALRVDMPARPEFAAAADMRECGHTAAFEPRDAERVAVARQVRQREAAVARQQARPRDACVAVERVARADQRVRHQRAVARTRARAAHDEPGRVELHRRPVEQHAARPRIGRAIGQIGKPAFGRIEIGVDVHVHVVVQRRLDRLDVDLRVARPVERPRIPAPGAVVGLMRLPQQRAVVHVVEPARDQRVARMRPRASGGRRLRREQRRERARTLEKRLLANREQRAARMAHAVAVPVEPRLEHEPAFPEADLDVRRHVVARPLARFGQPVCMRVEEVDAAPCDVAAVDRIEPHARADVVGLAAKHDRRVGERRAAHPAPRVIGITCRGRMRFAAIPAHVDGIAVDPADRVIARRVDREAVVDETALHEIEFAHDDRIGAARRQRQQRAIAVRIEDRVLLEHPRLALLGAERVDVEQRFPLGPARAPVVPARAAPQSLRMQVVLPQVVGPVAPAGRNHRALARQIRLRETRGERAIRIVVAQRGARARILLVDPRTGARAAERFEITERIGPGGPAERFGHDKPA
ncbi:hypothetical protein FEP94_06342 [Burkholderia pseudomultivorans]|nr:hypothetical protein [Burkholderia pseudomultivorans]